MATKPPVKTTVGLSTRTAAYWLLKRLAPGAGAFAFCLYGIPRLVDLARAAGAS